jgi:ubiquinone/menaquinone biosynthesis C-methylase UbiE
MASTDSLDTYYRDHWVAIDSERLERYDQLFRVPPERADRLLAPLELAAGHKALDLGCGPGFVAAEIARLVGPNGFVHAVDVNRDFVARAEAIAKEKSVAERISVHHVDGDALPLASASLQRAFAKNVLEYVPDAESTLREVRRTLAPGGLMAAVDSDWGFVVVEPFSPDEVHRLFLAAAPAFREPYIGRRLPGLFQRAGFSDVEVRVNAVTDRKGHLKSVIHNMLDYATSFGGLSEQEAAGYRQRLEAALTAGDYLFVLPQFTVRGYQR